MQILQIVESIHGELPNTGFACTILRLAGCNLACDYCDAPAGEGTEMSKDEIKAALKAAGNEYVLITGGEPLLQWKDLYELLKDIRHEYHITIETNGTLPLTRELRTVVDEIVMDIKLDTKKASSFDVTDRNVSYLGPKDVVKFVYEDGRQFELAWALAKPLEKAFHGTVVFSPVNRAKAFVADFVRRSKTYTGTVRMQLQIHKLLDEGVE